MLNILLLLGLFLSNRCDICAGVGGYYEYRIGYEPAATE